MSKRPKKKPLTRAEVARSFPLPPESPPKPKWDDWLDPNPEESDEYRDLLSRTKNNTPKSSYFTASEAAVLQALRSAEHGVCDVCGREGILLPTKSRLDLQKRMCCASCREARAETWIAVGNYCRSWPDLTPEAAWRKLPRKVKAMIRFWQNERYLPYRQAFRLMLRQQMIPVYPRAGEGDGLSEREAERLRVIMREWQRVEAPAERPDPPPDRRSRMQIMPEIMHRAAAWLRPFFTSWRHAYGY